MSDAREFMDRVPKLEPPAKKPPRVSVSTCIEQSTLAFITAEAEAKDMTPGVWIRHILELLESGEF
jgi:hypothetical protein